MELVLAPFNRVVLRVGVRQPVSIRPGKNQNAVYPGAALKITGNTLILQEPRFSRSA
jgi:hypothetical protein